MGGPPPIRRSFSAPRTSLNFTSSPTRSSLVASAPSSKRPVHHGDNGAARRGTAPCRLSHLPLGKAPPASLPVLALQPRSRRPGCLAGTAGRGRRRQSEQAGHVCREADAAQGQLNSAEWFSQAPWQAGAGQRFDPPASRFRSKMGTFAKHFAKRVYGKDDDNMTPVTTAPVDEAK
jgi:hypothetical protein